MTAVVSALVLAATAIALVSVLNPDGGGLFGVDARCGERNFSCGVLTGLLGAVAPVAVAFMAYELWRAWHVRSRYRAVTGPRPSGGGPIVGRTDLCDVLQGDLERREMRRPIVVIGGAGVGKTALLDRFADLLLERGAVPVRIRLDGVRERLDFLEEARAQFFRDVGVGEVADTYGGRAAEQLARSWRDLVDADRVVVLADGLDEALSKPEITHVRDVQIGHALAEAGRRNVPLVVASRPDEALQHVDAAVWRIEPLGTESLVRHLVAPSPDGVDDERARHVAEVGRFGEVPFYLSIARELLAAGLLQRLDARGADDVRLRVRLLELWLEALVAGTTKEDIAVERSERARAVDYVGVLACVGLLEGRRAVEFDALGRAPYDGLAVSSGEDGRRLVRAAGRLELVEPRPEGVRFPQGILQAYLASRAMETVWPVAVAERVPGALLEAGAELLMALLFWSVRDPDTSRDLVPQALLDAGQASQRIDVLAVALEAAVATWSASGAEAVERILRCWNEPQRAAEDAKLYVVAALGSARAGAAACDALWSIARNESDRRVQAAATRELGNAGDDALDVIDRDLFDIVERGDAYAAGGETPSPRDHRDFVVAGRVLPLLAASVRSERSLGRSHELLSRWVDVVARRMPASSEAALAQGLKHAANQRHGGQSSLLAEHAVRLLDAAAFWYSRLALIQALSLWALHGAPTDVLARAFARSWSARHAHPFVREAASLCRRAIETGDPSRYIWLDESETVAKPGPRAAPPDRTHWIPASTGWGALAPRAQQLLADVIVVLSLAEREGHPTGRERQLEQIAGEDLPACVTARHASKALRVAAPHTNAPGETCLPGCSVGLCPYPSATDRAPRHEFSAAFCRRQQRLATARRPRARPPWRGTARGELETFWRAMEVRGGRART